MDRPRVRLLLLAVDSSCWCFCGALLYFFYLESKTAVEQALPASTNEINHLRCCCRHAEDHARGKALETREIKLSTSIL